MKLALILLLLPFTLLGQEKTVRVTTDSCGVEKVREYNITFIDPLCDKCGRTACIWIKGVWYCKKHFKRKQHGKGKG